MLNGVSGSCQSLISGIANSVRLVMEGTGVALGMDLVGGDSEEDMGLGGLDLVDHFFTHFIRFIPHFIILSFINNLNKQ